MRIDVQLLRRQYWVARFNPHDANCVGEGRTKAEAIGNLILIASDKQTTHGSPCVTTLPPGELASKPMGK